MAKAKVYCSTNRIKTLKAVAAASAEVDDLVVVNSMLTIAYASVAKDNVGLYIYAADEVALPKGSGAINAGDLLYWDAGNGVVTKTPSTHKLVGFAIDGAGSSDTEVMACLDSRIGLIPTDGGD